MKTDGKFGMTTTTIEVKSSTKPIRIIPVGDIHYGAENHATEAFDSFCRYAKDSGAYFILMGDYLELFSATERRTLAKAYADSDLRDNARLAIEEGLKTQLGKLAKKLAFMKGRVLGVLGGNHSYTFEDGLSTDELLAQRLEAPYLGVLGCIHLAIDYHHVRSAVWIWAHHGKGGTGKTVGHQFNCVDDMAQFLRGDIYLMGDNHGRGVVPCKDELVPYCDSKGGMNVKQHVRYLGRTGSFLKGYEPGKRSYIVDSLLRPNSLGFIEFELRIVDKRNRGGDFSIQISGRS